MMNYPSLDTVDFYRQTNRADSPINEITHRLIYTPLPCYEYRGISNELFAAIRRIIDNHPINAYEISKTTP